MSFKDTRSMKGQTEKFGFGRRDKCFWVSFSSRTRKRTLEHFLNDLNRTNFKNRENAVMARNSVKNGLFRPSKHQTSGIFQDIYLKFCTHIHLTGFFYTYSRFFRILKILYNFFLENKIFDYFFPKFSKK